ncbi:MAG: hypothetical protein QF926_04515 [Alphaproteobacteria bacterium]|nr:hypothetical protein [Alphaproteobacteria bacterium]MDP6515874.1 hypothetical protein [Alphaproteobacteria bacterium]
MGETLDEGGLDLIFRAARPRNARREEPVSDPGLGAVFALMAMAPTGAKCSPAR